MYSVHFLFYQFKIDINLTYPRKYSDPEISWKTPGTYFLDFNLGVSGYRYFYTKGKEFYELGIIGDSSGTGLPSLDEYQLLPMYELKLTENNIEINDIINIWPNVSYE